MVNCDARRGFNQMQDAAICALIRTGGDANLIVFYTF